MKYIIYITPNEYKGNDHVSGPTPQQAKLIEGKEYPCLEIDDQDGPWYQGEAYVTTVNDDGEIWFISNRHVRVTRILSENGDHVLWSKQA